jgi:YjbE family integral membrane protein
MDIFSLQFLSALAAIVVIDLMLAGDNAIVIALAARNVPAHLQKRAIMWGTVGAIVVRSVMTLAVVWLLQVPGLLFAGGAVLIWIAYKLLLPDEPGDDAHTGSAATTFWAAMRTIVIADAVMGLDNVLAVAGAAHGSYTLVVLGLLISIPIVVWGSSWLLKWVDRYPAIVYFGSAVLAWTAVKMMVSEPMLKPTIEALQPTPVPLLYALVVGGVLWAGFVRNHRRLESRIHARLAQLARQLEEQRANGIGSTIPTQEKGNGMKNVLVPIGESPNSLHAVRHVVKLRMTDPDIQVHLLNVQMPLPRHISQFLGPRTRADYHRDRAEEALAPAREILRNHNIAFLEHTHLGRKAEIIVEEAQRLQVDHIVMSTARKNSLTRMLEDSTTNKVLELTDIPVELIAGDKVSPLEQYGVPAGIGTALALLIAAAVD